MILTEEALTLPRLILIPTRRQRLVLWLERITEAAGLVLPWESWIPKDVPDPRVFWLDRTTMICHPETKAKLMEALGAQGVITKEAR